MNFAVEQSTCNGPRQEDGSQVEFIGKKSWKEPSWQHLTEEIREFIFNKAFSSVKITLEKKKNLSDLI